MIHCPLAFNVNLFWVEPKWFLVNKRVQQEDQCLSIHFQGQDEQETLQWNPMRTEIHQSCCSCLLRLILGVSPIDQRMECSHGQYFFSCLGTLPWWECVHLTLYVYMPWMGILSLEAPPLWEWLSFHVPWQEWSNDEAWVSQRQGPFKEVGTKQIWRPWWKDSWSSFEDAEEVFLHWKMCHPWFWFLCIEGNCWIKEGRIFCQCLKQETMLLAISCPWGSNWLTTHTSNARRLEILMFSVGVWVMCILFGVWKSQTMWWRLWVPVVPWLRMYARKQEGCGPREMSYTEKSCTWSPSIGIFTTNTLSTTTTTYAILFQVLKTLWGPIAG